MKLPFARVLPIVFALMIPTAAFAEVPANEAPVGSTAATHAGTKGAAKARTKPAKKPKTKTKAKRAKTPSKAPKAKSGKKPATKS